MIIVVLVILAYSVLASCIGFGLGQCMFERLPSDAALVQLHVLAWATTYGSQVNA